MSIHPIFAHIFEPMRNPKPGMTPQQQIAAVEQNAIQVNEILAAKIHKAQESADA